MCRFSDAPVILDALDRVDFETETSLGHQMMGSGGMFEFQTIADIGRSIEQRQPRAPIPMRHASG